MELLLLAVLVSALEPESDFDDESALALESDFESLDEVPLPEVLPDVPLSDDDELESDPVAGFRA